MKKNNYFKERVLFLVCLFCIFLSGCSNSDQDNNSPKISENIEGLSKYIIVPKEVKRAYWQTGYFDKTSEKDWWLGAIFELSLESDNSYFLNGMNKEYIRFPSGMLFKYPFNKIKKKLPENFSPEKDYLFKTYSIDHISRSPLNNGYSFKLDDNLMYVFLFTM